MANHPDRSKDRSWSHQPELGNQAQVWPVAVGRDKGSNIPPINKKPEKPVYLSPQKLIFSYNKPCQKPVPATPCAGLA